MPASPESTSRRALIHRLFAVVDARCWEQLEAVFDPDVTYERPGYESLTGLDAVREFYGARRQIASGAHHLEAIVVEECRGACWGTFVGLLKDGTQANERFSDVYEFTIGPMPRIRMRRSYFFRPAI